MNQTEKQVIYQPPPHGQVTGNVWQTLVLLVNRPDFGKQTLSGYYASHSATPFNHLPVGQLHAQLFSPIRITHSNLNLLRPKWLFVSRYFDFAMINLATQISWMTRSTSTLRSAQRAYQIIFI